MGNDVWRNWSGSVGFMPGFVARPSSVAELVEFVERAAERGQVVRPVGAGHSSMPLVATDDVLVSLEDLSGVVDHDAETGVATVLPGTGLAEVGAQLGKVGLELENLGDVDYQAIAGAVGTGTHGTGESLGNLSATLVGGTAVTGTGELLEFGLQAGNEGTSRLTRAFQVSLGALGILTSLTLRVRPAYHLHRRNWITHIDWVLEHFDDLAACHRHVDFYWYPRSDLAQIRVLDEPGEEGELQVPGRLKTDETGPAHEIIPNARELRFEEMEYLLPREVGLEAFDQVRERIKQRHRAKVGWRVLVRTVAADAGMLSTAHGRATMTIATLQNVGLEHEEYFADIESLLQDHGGRPHWGKKHTMDAAGLRQLYPEFDDFVELRRQLDPLGVLLNDHLRTLLEAPA